MEAGLIMFKKLFGKKESKNQSSLNEPINKNSSTQKGKNELDSIKTYVSKGDYISAINMADSYISTVEKPGYNAEEKKLKYYFANYEEFIVFIEVNSALIEEKKTEIENLIFLSGYASDILQMKAYALFEMKRHQEAADVLYYAISEFNPIGVNLRFELIENYFKLNQLDLAEKELKTLGEFVMSSKDIAKLYRRLGFCKIEQGNHVEARICLQYSLIFEKSEKAIHEIAYIDNIIAEPWNEENFKEKIDWLLSGMGMGMCSALANEMNLSFIPTQFQIASGFSLLKMYDETNNSQKKEELHSLLSIWQETIEALKETE